VALTFKNAASCLLNKVVDLIFTKADLVSTKGVNVIGDHAPNYGNIVLLTVEDLCLQLNVSYNQISECHWIHMIPHSLCAYCFQL
jgi:hypothetical protein